MMNHFFEGLIILIITFCICTVGLQCLSKPYTIINFFEITNKNKIAALGSLKRLEQGASWNFEFDFVINKKQKIVKTISACTQSNYLLQ